MVAAQVVQVLTQPTTVTHNQALMIQSEQHILHLDDPMKDVNQSIFHEDRLKELREEYIPRFPPIATPAEEVAMWKPITDHVELTTITHLNVTPSTDYRVLQKDLKDTEARLKLAEKVVTEKKKIIEYDHKTQARLREKERMGMSNHFESGTWLTASIVCLTDKKIAASTQSDSDEDSDTVRQKKAGGHTERILCHPN